jgi:DNA-binding CsgD family transcriptional regulator
VEAAVRADRRDAAEAAVMRLTDYVGDDAPASELALAARCRALVTQEPDAKEELLSEALTFHERDLRPFSRARTLLLLGEFLRRQRRRKEARVPLLTALDIFEETSASPWAERTRRELRATGQSVRRRDEGALTELTLQERQIVLLVGNGATNRDVAAQLFLSPRTVEYHLRNVFSKLGISSRAELVRLQVEEATAAATD